jgi:hypothetical protein
MYRAALRGFYWKPSQKVAVDCMKLRQGLSWLLCGSRLLPLPATDDVSAHDLTHSGGLVGTGFELAHNSLAAIEASTPAAPAASITEVHGCRQLDLTRLRPTPTPLHEAQVGSSSAASLAPSDHPLAGPVASGARASHHALPDGFKTPVSLRSGSADAGCTPGILAIAATVVAAARPELCSGPCIYGPYAASAGTSGVCDLQTGEASWAPSRSGKLTSCHDPSQNHPSQSLPATSTALPSAYWWVRYTSDTARGPQASSLRRCTSLRPLHSYSNTSHAQLQHSTRVPSGGLRTNDSCGFLLSGGSAGGWGNGVGSSCHSLGSHTPTNTGAISRGLDHQRVDGSRVDQGACRGCHQHHLRCSGVSSSAQDLQRRPPSPCRSSRRQCAPIQAAGAHAPRAAIVPLRGLLPPSSAANSRHHHDRQQPALPSCQGHRSSRLKRSVTAYSTETDAAAATAPDVPPYAHDPTARDAPSSCSTPPPSPRAIHGATPAGRADCAHLRIACCTPQGGAPPHDVQDAACDVRNREFSHLALGSNGQQEVSRPTRPSRAVSLTVLGAMVHADGPLFEPRDSCGCTHSGAAAGAPALQRFSTGPADGPQHGMRPRAVQGVGPAAPPPPPADERSDARLYQPWHRARASKPRLPPRASMLRGMEAAGELGQRAHALALPSPQRCSSPVTAAEQKGGRVCADATGHRGQERHDAITAPACALSSGSVWLRGVFDPGSI